jgi:plastocyanin
VKSLRLATMALAVAATVLAACADDGPQPLDAAQPERTGSTPAPRSTPAPAPTPDTAADGSEPAGQTVTVQSIDNTFRPDRIEVAPGTEVVWVNRGRNEHDIASDSGFGVAAADFQPGDEYRHVFTEPGEYPYHCTIHGTATVGMMGTVVVTDQA